MSANIKKFVLLNWVCLFIIFFCVNSTAVGLRVNRTSTKIVVIDAGHGGKDPGSVVGIAKEKNIVLDIALKLGKLIRQNQKNIKVVFTRDGDYYVPLMDRAQIANKINANLFISIHANYCDSPAINGTETYVLGLHRTEDNLNVAKKENSVILMEDDYTTRYEGFNPNLSESYIMFELIQDAYLDQSVRFAAILQSNFKNQAQRHDREVRQAGFLVLRETAMPSVLIETGYLSNKKENSFLLTDVGRSDIAKSIYESLIKYLNRMDAKDNITVRSNNDPGEETGNSQKIKETNSVEITQTSNDTSKSNLVKKKAKLDIPENKKDKNSRIVDKTASDNKITYAIQLGVFSKKISLDSKVFKGISPIKELIKEGKYKYLCYESESLKETKANLSAVTKSFPDAFIVSVRNNQTRMVLESKRRK